MSLFDLELYLVNWYFCLEVCRIKYCNNCRILIKLVCLFLTSNFRINFKTLHEQYTLTQVE